MGLLWHHCEAGERLPQFPSWHWAGWKRGSLYEVLFYTVFFIAPRITDPVVWVEDGGILKFPDFVNMCDFLFCSEKCSRFLHIEAWTIPCCEMVSLVDDLESLETLRG